MAPPRDDDWSDSDEEELGEVETAVLLGVPDGPIDADADINDVAVSRTRGHPVRTFYTCTKSRNILTFSLCFQFSEAFLTSPGPSLSSSQCKICSSPMELLVQMWCPFEDSPMDRALYVWLRPSRMPGWKRNVSPSNPLTTHD